MKSRTQINEEMVMWILDEMPESKKEALRNALTRNAVLTSHYGLSFGTITIYKEGWYVHFDGVRCSFSVWAKDNDGELDFTRKPPESKLNKLYEVSLYNTNKFFEKF